MSDEVKLKAKELVKKTFSTEIDPKLLKAAEEENRRSLELHKKFLKSYQVGDCSLCNGTLDTFSDPCVHWLLRKSNQIKKHHIESLLNEYGLFRSLCYLRWVANAEVPVTNINNLKEDVKNHELYNCTIKYKNIEWTVWCTEQDYSGHSGENSNFPHWHFQMLVDGNIFIKFSDFHLKFLEEDILTITAIKESGGKFKYVFSGGPSPQDVLDNFSAEEMIDHMSGQHGKNEAEAPFHVSTIITSEQGISGDLIADALEEMRATGKTFASIMKRKLEDLKGIKLMSLVSPSDNIPDFKERSGRGKKNQK